MTDEELLRLKRELDEVVYLRANMRACQERCDALNTDNRALRRQVDQLQGALRDLALGKRYD
jgi:hypothetical protein